MIGTSPWPSPPARRTPSNVFAGFGPFFRRASQNRGSDVVPRPPAMEFSTQEQNRWFTEELQPHESMLRAWLRSQRPGSADIDDIVQEAYMRVLRARETTEIASPKAFLFATARNLARLRARHSRIAGENDLAEIDAANILDECADVHSAVARAEEFELLTRAIQSLPARCRQVLTLRKIYGLSQKEVAARLGISEHTVEAQGTIGLRKLTAYFERTERKSSPLS